VQKLALLIVVSFATSVQAVAPTTGTGKYGMSTSVSARQLPDGTWEYAYDIFAEGTFDYYDYLMPKFDFNNGGSVHDHVLNMYDPGTGPQLREFWTVNGMIGNNGGHWYWGGVETGVQASYGDLTTDTWFTSPAGGQAGTERWFVDPAYAAAEGMANPFHSPSEYARWISNGGTFGDAAYGLYAGVPHDRDGDTVENDLLFDMTWFLGGHMYGGSYGPELMATIRIVSDLAPYGQMRFQYYSSGTENMSFILGPGTPTVGDFDGDGDIDADDIDVLCANLGDVAFDVDGDGDADGDDIVYIIENLVVWHNGSEGGLGTIVGDFNFDGAVNGTDLSIMSAGFGTATGYAGGNANCDAVVNGTDLSILASSFGLSATAAIPEPTTLGLLTLTGMALLRRRK
jgi:hypothetical protein